MGRSRKSNVNPLTLLLSQPGKDVIKKSEKITFYGYISKNSCEPVQIASIETAFRLYAAYMELKKQKEDFKMALRIALEQQQQIEEELLEKKAELCYYSNSHFIP